MDIAHLMKTHGIAYVITISDVGDIAEFGDKTRLAHTGIIDQYFIRNPIGVFDWLDGQILPQILGQGKVAAFVYMPKSSLVVGVFSNRGDDIVAQYKAAANIGRDIALVWPAA